MHTCIHTCAAMCMYTSMHHRVADCRFVGIRVDLLQALCASVSVLIPLDLLQALCASVSVLIPLSHAIRIALYGSRGLVV
jgi:hypothetical protein